MENAKCNAKWKNSYKLGHYLILIYFLKQGNIRKGNISNAFSY